MTCHVCGSSELRDAVNHAEVMTRQNTDLIEIVKQLVAKNFHIRFDVDADVVDDQTKKFLTKTAGDIAAREIERMLSSRVELYRELMELKMANRNSVYPR
jgi:hypothetical protein